MKIQLLAATLASACLLCCCAQKQNSTNQILLDTTETNIEVEPIENLTEDFIFGCDVSSLISLEKSGVKFYNYNGEEQDLLKTLAENGVNTIRIRVWNDPYNSDGKGYGGGNNDLQTAINIGKRATEYGLCSIIDFHYSDFWADPGKQMCPKAWEDMSFTEKSDALYQYTYDSLKKLLDEGVNVSIVQVGNETTGGLAGETDWKNITTLMNSGSKAVRDISKEYNTDIKVALHFTNPEKTGAYEFYAKTLSDNSVDYDIFASSYYPYWHGSIGNLTTVLSQVADTYDKEVMVAECSYAYTYSNGDEFNNTINVYSDCDLPYKVSEQGQADLIRDLASAISGIEDKGIGICYWEPAWIPVPADGYDSQLKLWEEYGSGWASSHAASYDPEDAGKYYGGASYDNQALFDFDGHPLNSLSTFRLLQ